LGDLDAPRRRLRVGIPFPYVPVRPTPDADHSPAAVPAPAAASSPGSRFLTIPCAAVREVGVDVGDNYGLRGASRWQRRST
jgi:hypothetical protein